MQFMDTLSVMESLKEYSLSKIKADPDDKKRRNYPGEK